jgi:hypothetical protein
MKTKGLQLGLLVKLVVLLIILSTSGCSAISGRYGPFTFTVQTAGGEKVEDVIVTLGYSRPKTLFRGNHTYRETKIVNSGEKVTLPRGYVLDTEDTGIGMILGVTHMDYDQRSTEYIVINSADKNVTITLPDPIIVKRGGITEKEIHRFMKRDGFSYDETVKSRKRSYIYYDSTHYLKSLKVLGRDDLVNKYLTRELKDLYGDNINSPEAKAFEHEIRKRISL